MLRVAWLLPLGPNAASRERLRESPGTPLLNVPARDGERWLVIKPVRTGERC